MISAVFRRGGDVAFVAEELKAVFDPEGGRWMGGRYVPSLLAAIGDVIEEHMIRIGFLVPQLSGDPAIRALPRAAVASEDDFGGPTLAPHQASDAPPAAGARPCPRCGDRALRRVEGCWTCSTCAYSQCG
jgi:ribonucleoside-diphosphate reductase alpha chain